MLMKEEWSLTMPPLLVFIRQQIALSPAREKTTHCGSSFMSMLFGHVIGDIEIGDIESWQNSAP
jgi:hypothetical protein